MPRAFRWQYRWPPINKSLSFVHLDFSRLVALARRSAIEFSPFGYEQSGLHAWWRRQARNMIIMVGISQLEDVEGALTCKDVDAISCRIVKEIVRIAGNLTGGDFFSALGVEHEQARRRPSSDEEAMVSFV